MLKKVASVAKNGMTTRRLLGDDMTFTRDHSGLLLLPVNYVNLFC